MKNAIPAISTLIFVAALGITLFIPLQNPQVASIQQTQTQAAATTTTTTIPKNAQEALAQHRQWKNAATRWSKEIHQHLMQAEQQFPNDYLLTLEHLRGDKNFLSLEKAEKWHFFALAAQKAIAQKAEKSMLAEIETGKIDVKNGFGKLASEDAKKFQKVLHALKTKQTKALQVFLKP